MHSGFQMRDMSMTENLVFLPVMIVIGTFWTDGVLLIDVSSIESIRSGGDSSSLSLILGESFRTSE